MPSTRYIDLIITYLKLTVNQNRDEHGIELPDIPILEDEESFVRENIKHKKIEKPQKGVVVHVSAGELEHIGYALNEKEYIHKTINQGVKVSPIPKGAEFYEVIV